MRGQVFFASAAELIAGFDVRAMPRAIRIDVSHAHFWDLTAVGALEKVDEASATIVDRLAAPEKSGTVARMLEHG